VEVKRRKFLEHRPIEVYLVTSRGGRGSFESYTLQERNKLKQKGWGRSFSRGEKEKKPVSGKKVLS